jgi:hypothetical protein
VPLASFRHASSLVEILCFYILMNAGLPRAVAV